MNYYEENRQGQDMQHWGAPAGQYPPRGGDGPEKGARRGMSRWMVVAIACACILSSSALGFGGGMLAANLNAANATVSSQAAPVKADTPQPAGGSSAASATGMSVSEIVNSVSDTVVEITTQVSASNPFVGQTTATGAGSGVIISEDGYIVTNNHVIDGATAIHVRLKDGTSYPGTLVGTDPQTDVAVIKIEATGLHAAALGSSSALQVGDETVAIGNPLGELGGTVTNGIVSALDREITLDGETMTLMQTNAAINPGNSGGGLFNSQGELIGIVVAKSAGSGIEGLGFAIPIDSAKPVIEDLMDKGYVTGRGELGISVLDIQDQQTAFLYRVPQLGTYVAGVQEGSAAQQAGLKVGDCITAVGDTAVSSSAELKAALGKHKAGETVQLGVRRDTQSLTLAVTLDEKVPEEAQQQKPQAA